MFSFRYIDGQCEYEAPIQDHPSRQILALWLSVGYLLLASAGLIAFIRPLKKIVRSVRGTLNSDFRDDVALTASKIKFWSIIGILSTFLNNFILAFSPDVQLAMTVTLPLDACLNSFLVVVMAESSHLSKWGIFNHEFKDF